MVHHTPYFELRETLENTGCPICFLVHKAVQRAIESLAYEYANDYQTQNALRKARGFCNEHAWQLADLPGVALDVAILSRATLLELEAVLKRYVSDESAAPSLWQRLRPSRAGDAAALAAELAPQGPCPLCQIRSETESQYLGLLLEHLHEPEMHNALERAGGLCWPHFRLALQQPASSADVRPLMEIQRRTTVRLLAELGELIRKYDYRFSEEEAGEERDSWLRANAFISGKRGLW